jgi:hypothetical protein
MACYRDRFYSSFDYFIGVRGSVVGWGAVLQATSHWVFYIYVVLSAALWS